LCFERGAMASKLSGDRVTVRFVIGRDGAVSWTQGSSDAGNGELARCVASAFGAISFPEPEGGSVNVSYPLAFEPS
jgi:hypothetical protein